MMSHIRRVSITDDLNTCITACEVTQETSFQGLGLRAGNSLVWDGSMQGWRWKDIRTERKCRVVDGFSRGGRRQRKKR